MVLTGEWRELHRNRFPELAEDCGHSSPGAVRSADFRDWSHKATTPDQARIERYIDRFVLKSKRVLHVGIGNSGLAQRFHGRVEEIVGTTIDESEIEAAQRLDIPNYRAVLRNKYSRQDDGVPGRFDFIVDNNPTSACCCMTHLAELFDFYESKLAQGGQIVTDRQGLNWTPLDKFHSRWGFDFDDLAAVASVAGFDAWRINRNTYVLCHGRPAKPASGPRLRALIRRIHRFAKRVVHGGRSRITGMFRT